MHIIPLNFLTCKAVGFPSAPRTATTLFESEPQTAEAGGGTEEYGEVPIQAHDAA
jgi:hypothetical protein